MALADADPLIRSLVVISAIVGIVLLAQALGSALGGLLRRRVGEGVLSGLDQGAGAGFGLARGVFLVWLMGGLLAVLPLQSLASEARQSSVLQAIDERLPSPVVLAAELGRLIQSTGLPDVFVGAPPPAELPTGGVDQQQAEAIAADARRSTVRVESIGCGNFISGTAFAVSSDHFVTNAHVVAGSTDAWVSFDGSLERFPAKVVLIDPELDAAVIAVDHGLDVRPLEFSASLPARGDVAAAIGYTGGARERTIPVLISRSIEALGRDIYGGRIVAREVLELRADVAPGDSGGPLILEDGTVGGVIFSESRADPSIGYALSPLDVAREVGGALKTTSPASTGACVG